MRIGVENMSYEKILQGPGLKHLPYTSKLVVPISLLPPQETSPVTLLYQLLGS